MHHIFSLKVKVLTPHCNVDSEKQHEQGQTEDRIIKTLKDRKNTLLAYKQLWNLNENTNLILTSPKKYIKFLLHLFPNVGNVELDQRFISCHW